MTALLTQTARIRVSEEAGRPLYLHVETAGPPDGPLALLLHGFPDFWYTWRGQIGALARAGFFVVAPDQRGYNLSDKPRGQAAYAVDKMAGDALGILAHYGRPQAFVAGHDWGAGVAWHLAIHHPRHVARLAILNGPHPAAFRRALARPVLRQWLRSWYALFFQARALPEFLLSARGYAGLRRMLRLSSAPGTFTIEDLRRYREAWSQPGALTAMLNWYRAALRGGKIFQEAGMVRPPTLILWGERDLALIPELAEWSLGYCAQGELVRFPEASHWVQHEAARRVAMRLEAFFRAGSGQA